jgi:hypothetical protein
LAEDELLREISGKLDVLIKLTAMNAVAGKGLTEQIESLDAIGLKPSETADILGKPLNTITGIVARLRKRKSTKTGEA